MLLQSSNNLSDISHRTFQIREVFPQVNTKKSKTPWLGVVWWNQLRRGGGLGGYVPLMILANALIWFKSSWGQDWEEWKKKKNLIYKMCPHLLVAQHLNYPASSFLFIHAHKVMYSWGLTRDVFIDWQGQIAYLSILRNSRHILPSRRLKARKEKKGQNCDYCKCSFGSPHGQFHKEVYSDLCFQEYVRGFYEWVLWEKEIVQA